MEQNGIFELLKQVEEGKKTAQEAMSDISLEPEMLVGNYADIGRSRRSIFPRSHKLFQQLAVL